MRRPELVVMVAAIVVALLFGAVVSQRVVRDEELLDTRHSIRLVGPSGAKGLADVLEALDVPVEARQRAWFGLDADTASLPSTALPVLLDVENVLPLTPTEARGLQTFVARGGDMFVAGRGGVERCFGVVVVDIDAADPTPSMLTVPGGRQVRRPDAMLRFLWEDPDRARRDVDRLRREDECGMLRPLRVDTLLTVDAGRPAAWRLAFAGSGTVTMLSDAQLVSNQDLKETDAGLVIVPWLLESRPSSVVFDEYHQGFGRRTSIFTAAWRWMQHSPAGWTMIQLVVAGLLGLLAMTVRFGPAQRVVARTRRSPMEHLDALAVGLERAGATDTATELVVKGLRRRLSPRDGVVRRQDGDIDQWLAALELGARSTQTHKAVERLRQTLHHGGGDERVQSAASAVEDVWEALTHESKPSGF